MRIDLTGKRFGRLVVLRRSDQKNGHDVFWDCVCDCGNTKRVSTGNLRGGTVRSCGCLHKEVAIEHFKMASEKLTKHGDAGTPLYYVWNEMRQRCTNPNIVAYKWYGAKGIKVCEEWQSFEKFKEWAYKNGYFENVKAADPKDRISIDRIDSNGDYCPENCRWIRFSENATRATKARWKKYFETVSSDRSAGAGSVVPLG